MSKKFGRGKNFCNCDAFSLVEVMLALGVITLGLVVILALIPASLRSSKQSSDDLALSFMTQTAITDLHKIGLPALAGLSSTNYYFDANGRIQPSATGSFYSCLATPITPSAAVAAPVNSTNFIYIQLQFAWPSTAPAASQQKSVIVTSVGNYE